MGNFFYKSHPHVPLSQNHADAENRSPQSHIDIENMEEGQLQQRISQTSRIKNIYDWVVENKTFCATITTSACIMGYLYYLSTKVQSDEAEVAKITTDLMCSLTRFAQAAYANIPNITETQMWKDLTSQADGIMERYPPNLANKIKDAIQRCNNPYEVNIVPEDVRNGTGYTGL